MLDTPVICLHLAAVETYLTCMDTRNKYNGV